MFPRMPAAYFFFTMQYFNVKTFAVMCIKTQSLLKILSVVIEKKKLTFKYKTFIRTLLYIEFILVFIYHF